MGRFGGGPRGEGNPNVTSKIGVVRRKYAHRSRSARRDWTGMHRARGPPCVWENPRATRRAVERCATKNHFRESFSRVLETTPAPTWVRSISRSILPSYCPPPWRRWGRCELSCTTVWTPADALALRNEHRKAAKTCHKRNARGARIHRKTTKTKVFIAFNGVPYKNHQNHGFYCF